MWRTGLSNERPNMPSMTSWCDKPMPRTNRPPLAACTVSACCAIVSGWRLYVGTTPVASSMRGTSRPTIGEHRPLRRGRRSGGARTTRSRRPRRRGRRRPRRRSCDRRCRLRRCQFSCPEGSCRLGRARVCLVYSRPYADVAQLVERDVANVEVAGSSPVVRSRYVCSAASRPRFASERLGSEQGHEDEAPVGAGYPRHDEVGEREPERDELREPGDAVEGHAAPRACAHRAPRGTRGSPPPARGRASPRSRHDGAPRSEPPPGRCANRAGPGSGSRR